MKQRVTPLARLLAGLLLLSGLACDSTPPTPTPVVLPTAVAPRVEAVTPPPAPTATPAMPSAAQQAQVAALLAAWAVGDPAPAANVPHDPLSATADGAWTAATFQRAPVLTPTAEVHIEPAILLSDRAGQPQRALFAVAGGGDLLVPDTVVWAEHGAAAAVLFAWQIQGQPAPVRPFVLLDTAGARQGAVLMTYATADPPVWAPGGALLAYVDASSDAPRLVIVDGQGQTRVSGPATDYECARCWPDIQWAPAGTRLAYATAVPLPTAPAGASPRAYLTWRVLVLDGQAGSVLFDRQGDAVEEAHVLGWLDAARAQVVLRRALIPADQITGQAGRWSDTAYVLQVDPPPARLLPAGS
jgi:hypothetical protein